VIDPRLEKLAKILVNYSVAVKPGENVLVQDTGLEPDFDKAIVKAIHEAGGRAFVTLRDKALDRALLRDAPAEQVELQARFEQDRMKEMDCYIGFNAWRNLSSWSDLSGRELDLYNKNIWKKVHIEARLPGTRWVVLRFPSAAMAQMAAMSEEAFEDFFFDVCTMDYARMSKAMDPLVEYLARTDKVRIVSPGTDLSFSIKGLPPIKCDGSMNIPDGEVYTAPVRDSVNGVISYNTPSEHEGFTYENIRFEFKDGKIVKATSNDDERINRVLDTDEGARRLGEVALVPFDSPISNLGILFYNTLFDENASCHFALGKAYPTCLEGGTDMDAAALKAAGVNDSLTHVDFMVGSADLEITGIKADGAEVTVFKNGNFAI